MQEKKLTIALANSGRKWIGEVAHVAMLYEQLEALGHRPWIICRGGFALHDYAVACGWRVLPLHFNSRFSPLRDWADTRAWTDWARRERADVLHCHRGADHWRGLWVARRLGLPLIRTRHVVMPVRHHALNRWLYLKATDAVLCVSRATRASFGSWQDLLPMGGPIILSAVDSAKFHPAKRSDDWRAALLAQPGPSAGSAEAIWFGLIGRFQRIKGQRIFQDAAVEVARREPRARFLMAMPAKEVELRTMRRRAERLGLGSRMAVVGRCENLPEVMASLDVGVIASVGSEGSSRVGMELMASGLPVVATRVGGIPDLMEQSPGCRLVTPSDPRALAEGMLHWAAAASPDERRAAGEQNRRHVLERHAPRTWAENIVAIYRRAVG